MSNEAVKVAVELVAFNKAERQLQGNKYVRRTSSTSMSAECTIENSAIQQLLERLDKLLNLNETKKTADSVKELTLNSSVTSIKNRTHAKIIVPNIKIKVLKVL